MWPQRERTGLSLSRSIDTETLLDLGLVEHGMSDHLGSADTTIGGATPPIHSESKRLQEKRVCLGSADDNRLLLTRRHVSALLFARKNFGLALSSSKSATKHVH
ncbi:unnamed protein product [Peronospora belbahrii]|uniref:Uncharacterized protein n=1 Tax=Peronospora belbahrii TaxID=622444 RepID=A0ABN8D4U4_9STRA|nr:unnamed protein product [Peronospora belbahrii]